jgi:hypothetical protein
MVLTSVVQPFSDRDRFSCRARPAPFGDVERYCYTEMVVAEAFRSGDTSLH